MKLALEREDYKDKTDPTLAKTKCFKITDKFGNVWEEGSEMETAIILIEQGSLSIDWWYLSIFGQTHTEN